jgi:uncharacterized protein (TIGR02757 family)
MGRGHANSMRLLRRNTHRGLPEAPGSAAVRQWLEQIYRDYHRPQFRGLDPIDALGRYVDPAERELVGLIAACLAYGNVKSILRGIGDVLTRLGAEPRAWLAKHSAGDVRAAMANFRYRVTGGQAMAALLIGARHVIESHGSLNACFTRRLAADDPNVVPALGAFVDELCIAGGHHLYHLLPHPSRGSACKRMMLYLRWMVRCDRIDPGGWTGVRPAQLIVPLDTHLHRMALHLKLTRRRQPNLRTAIEVTEALRRFDPRDPLRYDFALTRPGILRVLVNSQGPLLQRWRQP